MTLVHEVRNLEDVSKIEELLADDAYKDNSVVQRRLKEEDFYDITDEIISERSRGLKYNKEEREIYNKKVSDLRAVIPYAYRLERRSFLSPLEPEGAMIWNGLGAALLTAAFLYYAPVLPVFAQHIPQWMTGIGLGAGAVSAAVTYSVGRVSRKLKSIMVGYASYLDFMWRLGKK